MYFLTLIEYQKKADVFGWIKIYLINLFWSINDILIFDIYFYSIITYVDLILSNIKFSLIYNKYILNLC